MKNEIQQLKVVLAAAKAKERERVWLRNQMQGELEETRLVDGIAGDANIFKRRGKAANMFGGPQMEPKRLSFVVGVSSSMAKMSGDGRLDRVAASLVLIMEALAGLESRFVYSIVGHSG